MSVPAADDVPSREEIFKLNWGSHPRVFSSTVLRGLQTASSTEWVNVVKSTGAAEFSLYCRLLSSLKLAQQELEEHLKKIDPNYRWIPLNTEDHYLAEGTAIRIHVKHEDCTMHALMMQLGIFRILHNAK